LDALPARAQLVAHLLVHGVQALRTVEGDGRDALGDVEDDGVHGVARNTRCAAGTRRRRRPRASADKRGRDEMRKAAAGDALQLVALTGDAAWHARTEHGASSFRCGDAHAL